MPTPPVAPGDAALDDLPVVAYRCRADDLWTCTFVASGIEALGLDREQWVADRGLWLRRVHPDDRERLARERQEAMRTGTLATRYRLRATDGDERHVHDRARVVVDEETGEQVVHGVLVDMTEQQRADRVVQQSFETATARADRLAFTQSVDDALLRLFGHDVRSPLSAAWGLVRSLLDAADDEFSPEHRRAALERVADALGRIRGLIEELEENWTMADLGAAESHTSAVDLVDLLDDVLDEVGADPDRVVVDCEGVVVRGIEPLVRRALVGLVRNAVLHTREGTSVVVRARAEDAGVVVRVEDDGVGIPDEDKARVFEPFVRLAEGPTNGLGLGLSLVREVARLHGGRTWVEDAPGGGAAFCLHLPDEPAPV